MYKKINGPLRSLLDGHDTLEKEIDKSRAKLDEMTDINHDSESKLEKRDESETFDDEAHFWLNGYVNKQNCRIWSEANPQVYVETSLHPEKLTVWCDLWAGGILLQKR
ncbi:uncharacterized protein TNCV_2028721 [Trichonephila clavipes]|nr:uncharacterized protein TNCV_2028721 [Trichonephila clavipes]